MAVIGGNLETKEIGLPFGLSGTFQNTQVDTTTGFLRLVEIDRDSSGNPIYADEGYWESDVIDLVDKFTDYDKIFITSKSMGSDSYAVQTRVSEDSIIWSDWTPVALDGAIQSDTKRYVQVKIILYAGFVSETVVINKSEFTNSNEFVYNKINKVGGYIVPTLTSTNSSTEGFSFDNGSRSNTYLAYNVFRDIGHYYSNSTNRLNGFVGFYFFNKKVINQYVISSTASSLEPKDFVLEASNDTTTGLDGTWVVLDTQKNVIDWTTTREYKFDNLKAYHAYRIRWSSNNGHVNYTSISRLNFFEPDSTSLKLKRDYEYTMTIDTTWSGGGNLQRTLITRDNWLRIDTINILKK